MSDATPPNRYAALGAAHVARGAFQWDAVDPEWQALLRTYVSDGMYQRPALDPRTRELCAIAALVALGHQMTLPKHFLSLFEYGATREEVQEVILQMSVYAGFPATQAALDTLRATLARVDEEGGA